jgi:ribosomal protein S18 acetylase RimI-like enzyme
MDPKTLVFAPIAFCRPGLLSDLLRRSYAGLVESCPEHWAQEAGKWDDLDREAFAQPKSIGKCVFVSALDDHLVGLASYDPRHEPEYGIVGQNCILPEYRGRGFGKLQIVETLRRFGERTTQAARVTTSEHPFFAPALGMYQSLGFREIRRFAGGPDPRYELVELEIKLRTGP